MVRYLNNWCHLFITLNCLLSTYSGNRADPTVMKVDTICNLRSMELLVGLFQIIVIQFDTCCHEESTGCYMNIQELTAMWNKHLEIWLKCSLSLWMFWWYFYFQYIHHSCAFFPVISRDFSKICWISCNVSDKPYCLFSIYNVVIKDCIQVESSNEAH